MIPITDQLQFATDLRSRLVRGNLRSVAEGKISAEEAQRQNDAMDSIVATLERQKLLAEVSEKMAAAWKSKPHWACNACGKVFANEAEAAGCPCPIHSHARTKVEAAAA